MQNIWESFFNRYIHIYIYIVSMHGLLKKKLLYINQNILTDRNAF